MEGMEGMEGMISVERNGTVGVSLLAIRVISASSMATDSMLREQAHSYRSIGCGRRHMVPAQT